MEDDGQIVIDQTTADAIYKRGGDDVFDLWWLALGVVVRLKALAERRELPPNAEGAKQPPYLWLPSSSHDGTLQ